MKRDYVTDFLFLLFVTAMTVMIWTLTARSVPAPLSRRPTPQRGIPHTCTMHWGNCKYHTTFSPCGMYRAFRTDREDERWTGTWDVKSDCEGITLTIRESHGDYTTNHPLTYTIKMKPCLRESVGEQVKFKVKK